MNYFKKYFPIILILAAVLFNLYTLFPELSIQIDLNDNIFHFGLVNRMNIVWQNSGCPFSLRCLPNLLDHNVPEWAQGYSLPYYYQHLPHLFVVATYKIFNPLFSIFHSPFSIFNHFHLLQYLLLAFFPIIMYFSCRLFGLPRLTSALAALLSTHLSTDGLYGLDVSSFTWRGFGVYSQLLAMIFLPLCLAQIYHTIYIYNKRAPRLGLNILTSVFLLAATFASHLAFGLIALLSVPFIPISFIKINDQLGYIQERMRGRLLKNIDPPSSRPQIKSTDLNRRIIERGGTNSIYSPNFWPRAFEKVLPRILHDSFRLYFLLFLILSFTFLLLSYWFIPLLSQSAFHAQSFWDSPWKWDSYGLKTVLNQFLNGALLDHDRFPIFTLLTLLGFFVAAYRAQKKYLYLAFLFPLWFILYMGRPTLGPLLKIIPMTGETHLHRLINGLHLSALFLAPIGLSWLIKQGSKIFHPSLKKITTPIIAVAIITIICFPVYRQTSRYLNYNKMLINAGNDELSRDLPNFLKLTDHLKTLLPSRLHVGKTGNWGHNQKAGPTPLYMALTTQGFETIGFLPETWSLNSDTEQFFADDRPEHYNLYNIRYSVVPDWFKIDFLKPLGQYGKYYLYETPTTGFFDLVRSRQTVLLDKKDIINPVHYWLFTDQPKNKEHPTLIISGSNTLSFVGEEVKFLDTANYQKGAAIYNLFTDPPFFKPLPAPKGQIKDEKINFQTYEAHLSVPDPCDFCHGLFKMTYHPNWQIFIDGQKTEKVMLFPAFIGFPITPGEHTIKAVYQPEPLKIPLLFLGIISLLTIIPLQKFLIPKLARRPISARGVKG
jgi:hypothetical protein